MYVNTTTTVVSLGWNQTYNMVPTISLLVENIIQQGMDCIRGSGWGCLGCSIGGRGSNNRGRRIWVSSHLNIIIINSSSNYKPPMLMQWILRQRQGKKQSEKKISDKAAGTGMNGTRWMRTGFDLSPGLIKTRSIIPPPPLRFLDLKKNLDDDGDYSRHPPHSF